MKEIRHNTHLTTHQQHRAVGALVGAACADALGAPYEFGSAGAYRRDFPVPVVGGIGEMRGGGGFRWEPGEFTDDTQMAVALAESLVARGGFDPDDVWARWQVWQRSAADVGNITRGSLSHERWPGAAEAAHRSQGRSAGNGALMRVIPVAVAHARTDATVATAATIQLALEQAALTHFDPAAGWGAALFAELVRRTIRGADPFAELDDALALVPADVRARFVPLLAASWEPGGRHDDPGNGTVWGCLAQALWAVRHHATFHDSVVAAIDLGGDTDTVACVAGALAGARAGIQAIPIRWTTYVHGRLGTPDGVRRYDNAGLQDLALRLLGADPPAPAPGERAVGPQEVAQRLHAADLSGAACAMSDPGDHDWAVLSLCRTGGAFTDVPVRREVHLVDQTDDANSDLASALRESVGTVDAWLAEGRHVILHCHGGRSRTAFVLKAWAMRQYGWTEPEAHEWLAERWDRYDPWNDTFTQFLRTQWPSVTP